MEAMIDFFAYYGEHTPSQEAINGHGDFSMTAAAPVSLEEDEEGRSFIWVWAFLLCAVHRSLTNLIVQISSTFCVRGYFQSSRRIFGFKSLVFRRTSLLPVILSLRFYLWAFGGNSEQRG
jgi:hypothetical protein